MIRRYSINKFLWMMNTVSPAASGRFLNGARVSFVSIQTLQFGSSKKCVKLWCLPVGLLVFGLLDMFAQPGRSVDCSSELNFISSSVFPCGSTTFSESEGSPERPSSKSRSHSGNIRDQSPSALGPRIGSRSPDAWTGTRGNTRFFRNCHNWHMVLQLAPYNPSMFYQGCTLSLFPLI